MDTVYVVLSRRQIVCIFSNQEAADHYCTDSFKDGASADLSVEAWSVEN